jgi:hypothetical protein
MIIYPPSPEGDGFRCGGTKDEGTAPRAELAKSLCCYAECVDCVEISGLWTDVLAIPPLFMVKY